MAGCEKERAAGWKAGDLCYYMSGYLANQLPSLTWKADPVPQESGDSLVPVKVILEPSQQGCIWLVLDAVGKIPWETHKVGVFAEEVEGGSSVLGSPSACGLQPTVTQGLETQLLLLPMAASPATELFSKAS